MGDLITVRQIRTTIAAHRFRHANEGELHRGITQILEGLGLVVQPEVRLDNNNRIDLTTELPRPDRPIVLGIEVKIAGNPGDVRRQVQRYSRSDRLGALLLVTTVYRHMIEVVGACTDAAPGNDAGARRLLRGMPFDVALINRGNL